MAEAMTPEKLAGVLFTERRRAFGESALEPLAEMPPDVQAAYRRFGAGVADRLGLATLAAERDSARTELEGHRQALMQAIGAPDLPWPVLLNRTQIDYAALIRQRNDAHAAIAEEQRIADERRTELLEERDQARHDLAEAEAERDDARDAEAAARRNYAAAENENASLRRRAGTAEEERDEARAELVEEQQVAVSLRTELLEERDQARRDLAAELRAAEAECEQWRATFGETALRDGLTRIARAEAERDEVREQVERVRGVVAWARTRDKVLLDKRDATPADNRGRRKEWEARAYETRALADRLDKALDGAEATDA